MNGLLTKTKCYLIGNMEFGDGHSWRDAIKDRLKKTGVVFFDPYDHPFLSLTTETDDARKMYKQWRADGDFDRVAKVYREIRAKDLALVDRADFIIAYLDLNVTTCGMWEELYWANRLKKPIFLVLAQGKKSCPLWLFGTIPHEYIYDELDSVVNIVNKIHAGKEKLSSSRWKLLKMEYR